jgi:hypothetical protein
VKKILIINGINTNVGGANVNTLRTWSKSILNKYELKIFHYNPNWYKIFSPLMVKIFYFFLFLPGSFFRLFKFPLFEFFNKISIFQFFNIIFFVRPNKFNKVLLSHHSVLYLYFLINKSKRVFIIHDLLYYRAKTMRYNKKMYKFLLCLEIFFYKKMNRIFILSYDEYRVLKKVAPKLRVDLISIIDFNSYNCNNNIIKLDDRIALVSDWRRKENFIDAIKFFNDFEPSNLLKNQNGVQIKFSIYGFNSRNIHKELLKKNIKFNFQLKGNFNTYNEIIEKVILVPNYTGAGIKVKVLEAINQNKFVVGTQNAFFGLPSFLIENIGIKINKPEDILNNLNNNIEYKSNIFIEGYNQIFLEIGSVI